MKPGKLLFKIIGRDGHVWKLYSNGVIEGFPSDVAMLNYSIIARRDWFKEGYDTAVQDLASGSSASTSGGAHGSAPNCCASAEEPGEK